MTGILRANDLEPITCDLWGAITQAIEQFTQTDCQNYFAAAGYDVATVARAIARC